MSSGRREATLRSGTGAYVVVAFQGDDGDWLRLLETLTSNGYTPDADNGHKTTQLESEE